MMLHRHFEAKRLDEPEVKAERKVEEPEAKPEEAKAEKPVRRGRSKKSE